MIINKKNILDFLSSGKQLDAFISYAQEIDNQKFLWLREQLINSNTNLIYWNNPSANFSFIAIGEIFSISNTEKNVNESEVYRLFKDKKNHYHNLNKQNFNKVPVFLGYKKFPINPKTDMWADYENQKWFIPKYLILKNNNYHSVIVNILDGNTFDENYTDDFEKLISEQFKMNSSGSYSYSNSIEKKDCDLTGWNDIVNASLESITKKELEKVVMARCVSMDVNPDINLEGILSSLENTYPDCYSYICRNNNSTFLGSTPEKLFSVNSNGRIETDALAGSIQRGENELADNELGMQLLESEKDINEHNSVRNFILEKLYPIAEDINYNSYPYLKKLSNIQHLWTPISARIKNEADIFLLVRDIYPTPAICGYPSETALKLIGKLENFDRGLYAGIIGWFNFENIGEFIVTLRSALIKNGRLTAFAGCGIVEGSNPLSEFNETELKLKPILSLFVNENINKS